MSELSGAAEVSVCAVRPSQIEFHNISARVFPIDAKRREAKPKQELDSHDAKHSSFRRLKHSTRIYQHTDRTLKTL